MSDLPTLLERVRGATEGSRELDFWIEVLIADPNPTDDIDKLRADIELVGYDEMFVSAAYSNSLDAALSLVERKLPGWQVDLSIDQRWTACGLSKVFNTKTFEPDFKARAPTAPLALITALLQALEGAAHD